MAKVRQKFLDDLTKETSHEFESFISSNTHASLEEFIQSIPKKQYCDIFKEISKYTKPCIDFYNNYGTEDEDILEQQENLKKKYVTFLSALTTFIKCFVSDSSRKVADDSLFYIVVALHDIIIKLHQTEENSPKMNDICNDIVVICEIWWHQKRENREQITPQTISFLFVRALENSKLIDVQRLYKFRDALLLIDFRDQSSISLKRLILRCLIHPNFLRNTEGKNFLVYLFGLSPLFISELHQTIKVQIPTCRKSLLESYGEVYFKAWKVASGPYLIKIEHDCIQDLIHCAVHTQNKNVVVCLRKVLGYFHSQKKQRGVDELLLRLYEPILWRSLKVANEMVRRNACVLLSDAFPLQNPDSTQREIDEMLQKQFNLLESILMDPSVTVRIAAIHTVCKVLSVFWELIPVATVRILFDKLILELVHDTSSSSVRTAVFEGLTFVLDNHLSQPSLKNLLPQLKPMIHDTSEKVRDSFLSLLLFLKGIRSIRFFDVVPVNHLLVRLVLDPPKLKEKITDLLLHSYFPHGKNSGTQIHRLTNLLKSNREAAIQFFTYVHKFAPIESLVKFIRSLRKYIYHCLKKEKKEFENNGRSSKRSKITMENENDNPKENEHEGGEITAGNTSLMEDILEICAIIWNSIFQKLESPQYICYKPKLLKSFEDKVLLNLYQEFPTQRAQTALFKIASFQDESNLIQFSEIIFPILKEINTDQDPSVYEPILECLFSWQYQDQVLQMLIDWLCEPLITESQEENQDLSQKNNKKQKRISNSKKSNDSDKDNEKKQKNEVLVALKIMNSLMNSEKLRNLTLGCTKEISELVKILFNYVPLIQKKILISQQENKEDFKIPSISDEILENCVEGYGKYLIHQFAFTFENDIENLDISAFLELIQWMLEHLMPYLQSEKENLNTVENNENNENSNNKKSRSKRQRNTKQNEKEEEDSLKNLIYSVLDILISVSTEITSFSFGREIILPVVALIDNILTSENFDSLFLTKITPLICKIIYQLYLNGNNEENFYEIAEKLLLKTIQILPQDVRTFLKINDIFVLLKQRNMLDDLISNWISLIMEELDSNEQEIDFRNSSIEDLSEVSMFFMNQIMRSITTVKILSQKLSLLVKSNDYNLDDTWKYLYLTSIVIENSKKKQNLPFDNFLIGISSRLRNQDLNESKNKEGLSGENMRQFANSLLEDCQSQENVQ